MSDLEQDSQKQKEPNSQEVLLSDAIHIELIFGEGENGKFPVLKFTFLSSHTKEIVTEVRYVGFVEDMMKLSNLIAKCGFQAGKEGCA
jgi:hypothetical protein